MNTTKVYKIPCWVGYWLHAEDNNNSITLCKATLIYNIYAILEAWFGSVFDEVRVNFSFENLSFIKQRG